MIQGDKPHSHARQSRNLKPDQVSIFITDLKESALVEPGKKQPAAEARAVIAFLVQEREGLSLTELGKYTRRDIAALSRAAGRIFEKTKRDTALGERLRNINLQIQKISNCQA